MKKKRYTLPEEQPIPVGWHPANEEEAVTRIEAIEAEYVYNVPRAEVCITRIDGLNICFWDIPF